LIWPGGRAPRAGYPERRDELDLKDPRDDEPFWIRLRGRLEQKGPDGLIVVLNYNIDGSDQGNDAADPVAPDSEVRRAASWRGVLTRPPCAQRTSARTLLYMGLSPPRLVAVAARPACSLPAQAEDFAVLHSNHTSRIHGYFGRLCHKATCCVLARRMCDRANAPRELLRHLSVMRMTEAECTTACMESLAVSKACLSLNDCICAFPAGEAGAQQRLSATDARGTCR
jgi:hypothetical protein